MQTVTRRLVALFLASATLSEDDVLLFQALDRLQERLLAQPHAPVQDSSIPRPQPIEHLRQADVVALALEPERATNDVQEHLELSPREIRQLLIEELVRYRSVVGACIAPEYWSGPVLIVHIIVRSFLRSSVFAPL